MTISLIVGSIRYAVWQTVVFALFIMTGCAGVGPRYSRPNTFVSPAWHKTLAGGLVAADMDPRTLSTWWTCMNDTVLSNLMERASKNNLNFKQARARVREARARCGLSKAGLFPALTAQGSVSGGQTGDQGASVVANAIYGANFDAAWELDLFGGTRRAVEAASADFQASREELRDVLVSLLAEVASDYIQIRLYQTRLSVAEANLASQNETSQFVVWRNKAGLSDAMAVEQVRFNLENTRAQIPGLKTGLEEAMNRIAVLIGEHPGALHTELEDRKPLPAPSLKIAVGVPADVLRRRPDIRKAERQLAAQTARIGAAQADLYPKFNLIGSIGLEALSLSKLFSSSTQTSNGSALVNWPIFKAGAVRKNIEIQSALQEQCLIAYEAAVLGALEEVENALTAFANEQERKESLWNAAQSAQKASRLARQEYQAGLIDFNTVLETQRSLLSFQDQLAQSEGAVMTNLVHLYKVFGGGWTSLIPEDGQY
jgi:NodT family efflux transporter outer membrane factor (OMF) lipoprotein